MQNTEQLPVIGHGSRVSMHYSIMLEDGNIADSSRVDNEPLEFNVGDGTIIEGLELAILGLKSGDKQKLRIGPETAYGFRDEDNIHWMPRSEFEGNMVLRKGLIIGFETPSGIEIPGMVLELKGDQVRIDFNHPFAGHEITFEVEILDVSNPAEPANDAQ